MKRVDVIQAYAVAVCWIALALGTGLYVLSVVNHAYLEYAAVAQVVEGTYREARDLYREFCQSPDAPADRLLTYTCTTARDLLNRNLWQEIIRRWMRDHVHHLVSLERVCGDNCLAAIASLLSWTVVIKTAVFALSIGGVYSVARRSVRHVRRLTTAFQARDRITVIPLPGKQLVA